jgi:hypothetical protein
MIHVLRTWAAPVVAAVVAFMTNWRVSATWVYPYHERVYPMTGRPMMGGD